MNYEEYNSIRKLTNLYVKFEEKIANYRVIDLLLDRIPSFGLKTEEVQFTDEIEICLNKHSIPETMILAEAIQTLKDRIDKQF
ncbi:hypothetical protein J4468_01335 [Candidatus Woesearchaeota archaeon]|nr:hypothetical protein [Candidatus Woesearchaeota archaeon]